MMSSEITMLIGGGAFLIIAAIYLLCCGGSEAVADKEDEVEGDQPVGQEVEMEEKKQGGKSFKQLK